MTTLLLGPALGTGPTMWQRAAEHLPAGVRTVVVPLPGTGEHPSRSADAMTITALADGVLRRADAEEVERFHFAGVSLSGLIAIELARRHPDRMASVVVISAGATIARSMWLARAARVHREGMAWLAAAAAGRWFGLTFLSSAPQVAQGLIAGLATADPGAYSALCSAIAQFEPMDDLAQTHVPALVINGERDIAAPPEDGAALAALLPRGEFRVIPDAAHLCPVERPVDVAKQITDFLHRVEQAC
ncbi:alpha/beta fold hydrolase [Microbacterium sp.]|uniref:alpha/beta fold hydrolase n=1 Tax=Microbacterium sp. TaxID=51671 RepID=UPI003C70B1C8